MILDDESSRQIISLGRWISKEESPETFKIWIHFRASGVEIFEWNILNNCYENSKLVLFKKILTSHYGFCKAVEDWRHSRFILPDYEVKF